MLELGSLKKYKINLADYNSQQDIENRIMLADFTELEHQILGEILFSSLKISLRKFSKSLGYSETELLPVVQKLALAGLLSIDGDTILIDKEMRKYFECHIARFDADFKPDMEFLQNILKKVPIHVLPNWYAIPRTSSNIFESILEKYLLTPQIFTRYLAELSCGDTTMHAVLHDIYAAPSFQMTSSDLIAKYNLSRKEFEEIMLLLEFSFLCCLSYVKEDDHWIEVVSPFYEWRQYLLFLQQTVAPRLSSDKVLCDQGVDFAFVEMASMALYRNNLKNQDSEEPPCQIPDSSGCFGITQQEDPICVPLPRIWNKLCCLHLAQEVEGNRQATESAKDWLNLSLENRASYLYRHPLNKILFYPVAAHLNTEKNIHEVEKSLKRILHGEWVYVDDFIQGALPAFDEHMAVTLKKTGKTWRYVLPQYSEEQKTFIRAVLFEWLFEAGLVALGTSEGRDCLRVTSFGREFF